jgi:peptidyl-prolyl cis-trans isomerase D
MLNALRTNLKESPFLKWVLIAVGVGLVAYLGSYFAGGSSSRGGRPGWIAQVNGVDISERRLSEVAWALFGPEYSRRSMREIGRPVLEQAIWRELIVQDARRLGLHASNEDLQQRILNDPRLQDEQGRFRFATTEDYESTIEWVYPGGVAGFERMLVEDILQERWADLVTQPVAVTDDELREIYRRSTERTAIDYVFVPSAGREVDEAVDDAELRRWYDEHVEDYARGPGRKIRYVVVRRDDLLDSVEVGDDAVVAYYESNQAAYTHPEQRRARHILFRLDPGASDERRQAARSSADEALERLRAGEDLDALARELSDDELTAERGGDLGFLDRDQMVLAFGDAGEEVFRTPVGEYAPVVETPRGVHVLEITDRRDAGITPLDEVRDDIRRLLQSRQIGERVTAEANRLREEIGTADRLEEVAAREGLNVLSGFHGEGEPLPDLRGSAELDAAIEALEPGSLGGPLPVFAGSALVVVDEVVPAGTAPFEDVRDQVEAAVIRERSQTAAVDAARAAFERDPAPTAVAEALGLEMQSSAELAPGQMPRDVVGPAPELQAALFAEEAAEGDSGVVPVRDGALVYRISKRSAMDPERFEQDKELWRERVLENRRAQHFEAVASRLRSEQEILYNPLWLEAFGE